MTALKELRMALGKSRAKVAADLDMSERHLYRLETGATKLRRIHALAFARYYDVEVETIAEAMAPAGR